MSDYLTYRGRCKEMAEDAAKSNPELTVVRGHYICPMWGKQQHWWCEDPLGNIVDPSAKQFPSKGCGEYEPFDGFFECEVCRERIAEDEAYIAHNHFYCSCRCFGWDVMGV